MISDFCLTFRKKIRRHNNPKFIYLVTQDYYYQRILITAIKANLDKYPQSEHLLLPQFGIRNREEAKSRYPILLKKIQLFLKFIYSECALSKLHVKEITQDPSLHGVKLKVVSTKLWVYFYLTRRFISSYKNIVKDPLLFINHFEINGIYCGDLIADSFIRYHIKDRVDLTDKSIPELIGRSKALIAITNHITNGSKGYFYGQYSTYTHHGIPLRVAFKAGWECVTFASATAFFKIHSHFHLPKSNYVPSHVANHNLYTVEEACQLPESILLKAERALESRVSGTYDSLAYMRNREFKNISEADSQYIRDSVVLMMHNFNDSAHAYAWCLFPDFWSWVVETIEFCIENQINLCLKPHPNEGKSPSRQTQKLLSIYPESRCVHWLSNNLTNYSLFQSRPKLVTSIYGSIAAECAFQRVPILLCGDHPCVNFDIGWTARTKQEYFDKLKNPPSNEMKINKKHAIYFTAMHFKNAFSGEGDSLRNKFKLDLSNAKAVKAELNSEKASAYIDSQVNRLTSELFQKRT